MKILNKIFQILRTVTIVFLIAQAPTQVAYAQGNSVDNPGRIGPGPGNSDNAPGHNAAGAPIDGGASLLLAGGVAYAVRRVRQARKKAL
jgi:hypothetical protein